MNTKDKLVHALTAYDRRRSNKRDYNAWALAGYLERLDMVMERVDSGCDLRVAIMQGFSDRLQDVCLKAVGLPLNAYTHA